MLAFALRIIGERRQLLSQHILLKRIRDANRLLIRSGYAPSEVDTPEFDPLIRSYRIRTLNYLREKRGK